MLGAAYAPLPKLRELGELTWDVTQAPLAGGEDAGAVLAALQRSGRARAWALSSTALVDVALLLLLVTAARRRES